MSNNDHDTDEKKGYLDRDFQFFHIQDKSKMAFEFHFHDFHKIIIFISGRVNYLIEGKSYQLKPWDILLVNSHEIHKPQIDAGDTYERMIIWVKASYLLKQNSLQSDLLSCFSVAAGRKGNLLRPEPDFLPKLKRLLGQLEASNDQEFGSDILRNAVFLQLMVFMNRLFLGEAGKGEKVETDSDEGIDAILNYINTHLGEDLSMENLASRFFLSQYHLMRKFKFYTGYTVHNYILQKRLLMAGELIQQGKQAAETCALCGFSDYSNFSRAFKKMFGLPPKQYRTKRF